MAFNLGSAVEKWSDLLRYAVDVCLHVNDTLYRAGFTEVTVKYTSPVHDSVSANKLRISEQHVINASEPIAFEY